MPGDYYVNASLTRLPGSAAAVDRAVAAGQAGRWTGAVGGPGGRGGAMAALAGGERAAAPGSGGDDQEQINYAPTYYPGVTSVDRGASRHASASARKLLDINFGLQLVRTSRIERPRHQSRRHARDQRQRQPDARGSGRGAATRSA